MTNKTFSLSLEIPRREELRDEKLQTGTLEKEMTIKRPFQLANSFGVLIALLRDRPTFLEEIRQGIGIRNKIVSLLISSSAFFALYGAIVGASDRYHSIEQALSSAVKLPALYLMTLGICFPTLYFFSILFGSRRTFGQYFALLMSAIAVISVLLFSFAPITLFFLITAYNYQFFKLLNVAILGITGFIGINSFYQGMQYMAEQDNDEGQAKRSNLLKMWLVLYAFVGSQLGWTLRPFFGDPEGGAFVLFRSMEGNFFQNILQAIPEILGFR